MLSLVLNGNIPELIELIALSEDKDHYIIGNGQEMIDMANEYAASGLETLFTALRYGSSEPLYNMVLYFQDNLLDKPA